MAWLSRGHRWAPGVRNPLKSLVMGPSLLVNCYLEIKVHKKIRVTPPPLLNQTYNPKLVGDTVFRTRFIMHISNHETHLRYYLSHELHVHSLTILVINCLIFAILGVGGSGLSLWKKGFPARSWSKEISYIRVSLIISTECLPARNYRCSLHTWQVTCSHYDPWPCKEV